MNPVSSMSSDWTPKKPSLGEKCLQLSLQENSNKIDRWKLFNGLLNLERELIFFENYLNTCPTEKIKYDKVQPFLTEIETYANVLRASVEE